MNEWFECKVKYERTMDDGKVKKVNEPYLVDALSFTEAEERIIEERKHYMSGEFQVSDIKRALRRIVGIYELDANKTYYIRLKSALKKLDSQCFLDYFEYVPNNIYNGTEPEDIW